MSKFKNKKALTLAVGAIMAGVSVIGVVAACAPTKAKPNKPSQGTQNPSQSGGTQSSNPGSGNTTTPSGQGSGNNTTNPSAGSTNTSPGGTNPGSQAKPEDKKMQDDNPNVDKGEQSGKSETPGANGKDDKGSTDQQTKPVVSVADDAKLIKEESKYSLTLSVTNADNKYLEVELTEVVNNQQEATKVKAKAKVESNNVTVSFTNLKPGNKYKVSALKLYENETTSDGISVDLSTTLSSKEFSTEQASTPKVNTPAPTPQNPVSITLEDNAMLVKKDSKHELSLNVSNADGKYLEIELTKVNENSQNDETTIISNKVKVEGGKVTVSFDKLEEGVKYKITDAQLYPNEEIESGDTVQLSGDLTKKVITIKSSDSSDQGNKDQMSGSGKADAPQPAPQADQNVKPVTASLDATSKLTENKGDFGLTFKFENADKKFVEVELVDSSDDKMVVKSKKVEVTNNQAVVIFDGVKLISKYKVKSINLFDKSDATTGKEIKLAEELTNRVIDVDAKVIQFVSFKRGDKKLPEITLKMPSKLYSQIDNQVFEFLLENRSNYVDGFTYFVTIQGDNKQIYTMKLNDNDGMVTFQIFPAFEYANDPKQANNYIDNLWLKNDAKKNNLLKNRINFTS
ncbi:hypothetical protein [Ureaplasma diversum]|uniref:Uncharacterized protein n=1 Tax=Ureaplasma diversum NCTC 246 TaxID=1188241 RepID=A0A084EZE2_9BACT|nr:hypothetical protein [Ureaplasma diversum]KEZ23334.1 Hypothetical protein, predicted lipoprotein [Ureaplasma diversum NCTC 246]